MIDNFRGKYWFLSNFSPVEVCYKGAKYPTVEHAYQAQKVNTWGERQQIKNAPTPGSAKRLARNFPLRPDWEEVKVGIMLELLRLKFRNPELKRKLLATGREEIMEGNTWNDMEWGCMKFNGEWVGENKLGKLLMRVREEMM